MIAFLRELMQPEWMFLRYALLVGALASLSLGVIGTMVVTRRISSLAGASAHAALGGVGVALFLQRVCMWTGFTPMLGAVIGAMAAALLVGVINLCAKEREDTIINVVWALFMSVGLLFLARTPGAIDLQGYLFGNIVLLDRSAIWRTMVLDVVVLAPTVLFYNNILAMSFDATFAELRGIRVKIFYLGLLALTALTIVLLIDVVGIILVIALLTLPAATAGCFTRHLWSMMILSSILSWVFVTAGLLVSSRYEFPAGLMIVVLAGVVYVVGLAVSSRRKAR